MKASVDMLEDRLKGLEGRPGGDYRGGGGSFKQQGYLPLKETIPEHLGKQPEKWREWKRDILGYVDSITNGMKKFLNSVELHEDDIFYEWVKGQSLLYGPLEIEKQYGYSYINPLRTKSNG